MHHPLVKSTHQRLSPEIQATVDAASARIAQREHELQQFVLNQPIPQDLTPRQRCVWLNALDCYWRKSWGLS